ncbi:tRNA pseudouridine synthase B [Botrimarina colliarenosi]|uniref:tRNA pseudouridine synthase B n=1 Tax=Botrimarina colliarenosi TaxID=2528001 RepID=A0A5C6A5H4_9BACT|nr:tRNA pseudouridine synthase B [Botrimarina colliarenosi]
MVTPFGLLNVNKPAGKTSRDVVNRVQWLLKQIASADGSKAAKVGHAGTLDPIATGVLVLCVGPATRLLEHVQRQPKRYRGAFLLGRTSPSDDTELPATELPDAPVPTLAQIEAALPAFVGDIEQVPPAYSAIKIGGEKAYDLARAGKAPEMKAREVSIYGIEVVSYTYPELVLDIRCGSGTYVRAIGRDLAQSLESGAVMSALERTESGGFRVEDAVSMDAIDEATVVDLLLPAGLAVTDLPRIEVGYNEVGELHNGRFLDRPKAPPGDELAAFDVSGRLIALLKPRKNGRLQPTHVFK